ncbi:hypothetical protein [Labrys sp. 22185]|uniref:hypothetical protein n=1 Tax=Labrys sp. 22185 TaxID=3453888 RepID=UPI003F85EC46
MTCWHLLSRLLSIVMIASLLSAPMAPFSAAMAAVPLHAVSQAAMASDMPCCPEQNPSLPGGQKSCPVAIVCMAKCAPGDPIAVMAQAPLFETSRLAPSGNDLDRTPFITAPPDRPPRA